MANNGIIQHGGSIEAKNIAVGSHASVKTSVVQTVTPEANEKAQVVELLNQVLERLSKLKPDVLQRNLAGSVDTIRSEISKEQPNALLVGSLGTAVLDNLKQLDDSETFDLFQAAFDKFQK